ncbi:MAG: cbb3-type cytochrome c oxidase subunit II [Saprospiraceae bacterium]
MCITWLKLLSKVHFLANEEAEAPARVKHQKVAGEYWHRWIEGKPMQMLLWSTVLIAIGGIVQIVPMVFVDSQVPKISAVEPYTPLELTGRTFIYGKDVWSLSLTDDSSIQG